MITTKLNNEKRHLINIINKTKVIEITIGLLIILGIGIFYFDYAMLAGGIGGLIGVGCVVIALILTNFISTMISFIFTMIFIGLYYSIFDFCSQNTINSFTNITMALASATILLCLLLFNIIRTSVLIAEIEKPKIVKPISILYSIRFIYPIISYIVTIGVTINGYAIIYSRIMTAIADNKLILSGSESLAKIDYLYFSMTTFFTVGYGDILAQGEFIKGIVISEMIVGSILQAVALPILLSICLAYIDIRKIKNRNKKKSKLILKPKIELNIKPKTDIKEMKSIKRYYHCKRNPYKSIHYKKKR